VAADLTLTGRGKLQNALIPYLVNQVFALSQKSFDTYFLCADMTQMARRPRMIESKQVPQQAMACCDPAVTGL